MKSIIVRLSVLSIVTAGFAASTVTSRAVPSKDVIKPVIIGTVMPSPMCTPGSGSVCGLH